MGKGPAEVFPLEQLPHWRPASSALKSAVGRGYQDPVCKHEAGGLARGAPISPAVVTSQAVWPLYSNGAFHGLRSQDGPTSHALSHLLHLKGVWSPVAHGEPGKRKHRPRTTGPRHPRGTLWLPASSRASALEAHTQIRISETSVSPSFPVPHPITTSNTIRHHISVAARFGEQTGKLIIIVVSGHRMQSEFSVEANTNTNKPYLSSWKTAPFSLLPSQEQAGLRKEMNQL